MFRIAEAVGRPVYELDDMPPSEIREWAEWMLMKVEAEEAARKKAKEEAERERRMKGRRK